MKERIKEGMINRKILVIVTLFIGGSPIIGADNIFAQDYSKTGTIGNSIQTYEDPDIGISFQYPLHWTVQKTESSVAVDMSRLNIDISEGIAFSVNVISLGLASPPITTLKDFARYQYETWHSVIPPNVINDNQTTVAGDHPALQMEYSGGWTANVAQNQRHGLEVWTIDRGIGYHFTYITDEGPEFAANIPSIRKMLDSIEFIPLAPPPEEPPTPKEPSFMD